MSKKREVALWSGIYGVILIGSFLILEILVFTIVVPHLSGAGKEASEAILSLIVFFFSYLFASYIAKKTRRKRG